MISFRRALEGSQPEHRPFEAGSLPDSEKEALCLDLLGEFGAQNIRRRGDEIIHSCVLPFGLHANGDRNPSASLNWKKLTYRCLGCDNGGGLLWFIATCRNESSAQARKWLSDQTGSGSDAQPLSAILKVIDDAFAIKGQRVPIPRMNSRILEPWYAIHPYMTEIRGVPAQTLMQHHVGWNPKTNRIVIPHFWKGDLVGWQTRRLVDDGTPKYESSGDFPKDVTVYNYVERADSALVVESAMSVLSKEHLGVHMEATFGAAVTDTQVRLLSRHPTVTLWFDNDNAGWKATEHVGEALGGWCNVFVVDSPWAADPADVDDQTFLDLVAGAVPFSIWQRPSVLIPWEG